MKEHSQCFSRRLTQWELGKFDELLQEASVIQAKLTTNLKGLNEERLAKTFAKFVLEGKINAAMELLDQQSIRGVLPLPQSTINELKWKHAEASQAHPSLLIDGQPPFVDPIMFQNITESTIANAALRTRGSGGPSGLDADGWRRILVSKNFGVVGQNLRSALVIFVRKISTIETEVLVENGRTYTNLEAYTACRLIPLDKNPGVRPIGVGEVLRRIVGKAILSVIKPEIMSSAGNLQLCADKRVDVRLLYMPRLTSSTKSLLMHCSWWMQTMPLTRLIEGSFSTISSIYAHRWPFISETVILYHLAYLYLEELKFLHQKGPHRVIPSQCQYMPLA